jgi:hypothetical protein
MKKTATAPAQKSRRKTKTVICPHCGADFDVQANGRYICPECENYVDIDDWFEVPAVSQHPSKRKKDYDACGWATTKWLLLSFGVLDVSDKALRKELNTDAKTGIRAWWNKAIAPILLKHGLDVEIDKGTLPWAIIAALSKRGITVKNPVRFEKFREFKPYLNDTFNAGGRGVILAWRTSDWCAHWMGVERRGGRMRVMDPWEGRYMTFREATSRKVWDRFLVFGFVRS